MDEWIPCRYKLPPLGELVLTKIDDAKGSRNIQALKRGGQNGRVWFIPDGDGYVYYEPTHWQSPSEHWRQQVCEAAGLSDLVDADWPRILGALAGLRDRLICLEENSTMGSDHAAYYLH